MKIVDKLQEVKTSIKTKFVQINPEDAMNLIESSVNNGFINRRRSETHVRFLAKQMAKGGWKINGETIILDKKGRVINGQHRLMACVKAGKPFQTLLVYDVPTDTFVTMDTGVKRTAAQTMQIAGFDSSRDVSSLANAIMNMIDSNGLSMQSNTNVKRSNAEYLDFVNSDEENIANAVDFATTAYKTLGKGLSVRILGTLYYYLVTVCGQDKDAVSSFLSDLTSADSSRNTSLNAYRRNFIETTARYRDDVYLYVIQSVWNAIYDGTPMPSRGFNVANVSRAMSAKEGEHQKKITMPGFHV